jgi:phosphate/sulfate permease
MNACLPVALTFCIVSFFIVLQTIAHFQKSAVRKTASGGNVLSPSAAGVVSAVTLVVSVAVYAAAHFGQRTAFFKQYIDSLPLGDALERASEPSSLTDSGGEEAGLLKSDGSVEKPSAVADDKAASLMDTIKGFAFSGLDHDVLTPVGVGSEAAQRAHDLAVRYDPHTERLFSAVQVFTASFASLAHGSNDVANAVAPLSIIAHYWGVGSVGYWNPTTGGPSQFSTPLWCLFYGGVWIDIGLLLCGYRVMRSLGNNITYHSPSRGYCMELGALTTVLIASAAGVPVSTTHCITGATVGVGLCTGKLAGINWSMVAITFLGWVVTLPGAGLVAGLSFAAFAHSPKALPTQQLCPHAYAPAGAGAAICSAVIGNATAKPVWQLLPQDWCAAANFSRYYDADAYNATASVANAFPW